MKFLKSSVAILGAIACIASPAAAQYGIDSLVTDTSPTTAGGVVSFFKAYITGNVPTSNLMESENSAIVNITDANYLETIFEDEWIIAL
jgi:hypothetical protein